MSSPAMTRRGFVKAAALTGAVAALGVETSSTLIEAPEAFAASGTERTAIRTCCHGCIQCCPCIGYLEDGVIVKLEGDPEAPVSKGAMCLKGMAQQHTAYSPLRILYPMKRVGERGAANASWERISWDEAIDLAADQFITSVEKYGTWISEITGVAAASTCRPRARSSRRCSAAPSSCPVAPCSASAPVAWPAP